MKNTYLIIAILYVTMGCKAQTSKMVSNESPCHLKEESFENSALRKFLETSTLRRDIIDKFLNSNFDFSLLSIIDNNIMIATYDGQKWEIEDNEKKYEIVNNNILKLVEDYANMNIVLKMSCPQNYIAYDVNEFQAFWIKKNRNLQFLYYSTTYEMSELNSSERKKVDAINEIRNTLIR